MKHWSKQLLRRCYAWLATDSFLKIIIGILVLQAGWLALTGLYPMAFDEDFHLGIIRLYAHHISPFWSGQPAGANAFGAVARDPSYLYQYLMSFPYRLLTVFTHSQVVIVMVLRAINIALFASALPLYRRLLVRTGASRAIVHVCLLLFVLLPVVPLLAAQINYDNLLMPLVAWTLLATLDIKERLQMHKLPVAKLVVLLAVCLLTSLVKYAFLPIFAAIVLYLAFYVRQAYAGKGKLWHDISIGVRTLSKRTRWLLVILIVVSAGLFTERYGVNVVRYGAPIPKCEKVLSVQQCSAYGPWIRDYNASLNKVNTGTSSSPVVFAGDWFYGMWLRTFFAVDGPTTDFETRLPLPVPSRAAVVVGGIAAVASLAMLPRLWRRYNHEVFVLFGLTTALYVGSLFLDEYKAFIHTGQPVAINGRYLFPVALFIMVFCALGLNEILRQYTRVRAAALLVIVICALWGGGALTYILRSNNAWYWNNQAVRSVNHAVQNTIGPITPGYIKPD